MTESNSTDTTVSNNATATSPPLREELIASAVNFLRDPKVQNSAIEKRLDFLKNKGLTQPEIDQALSRANVSATSASTAAPTSFNPSQPQPQSQPQPAAPATYANTAPPVYPQHIMTQEPYQPSWKDYFITSAVAGVLGYGLYTFCNNVLGPVLNWPSEENLAEEKERLDKQFDKAFEAIETMRTETASVLNTVQDQTTTINETLNSLTNATQALKTQDEARNLDVDRLSEELDQIRKLVPELFEKNQQTQSQLMDEIQQEIKSLKTLVSRKTTSAPAVPTAAYLSQISQPVDSSDDASKQTATSTNGISENTSAGLPSWQSGSSSNKTPTETQSSPASPSIINNTTPATSLPSWQSGASSSKAPTEAQSSSSSSTANNAAPTHALPSWQSAAKTSTPDQASTSS